MIDPMDLEFLHPLPGLHPHVDYRLEPVDGAVGLFSLESRTDEGIRLFLVQTSVYVPDYSPTLPAAALAELRGDAADAEVDVFVVATAGDGGPVVNLLAPVAVVDGGRAMQVILEGTDFPVRAELVRPAA